MRFHQKDTDRHVVDVLFVLTLFGVFAASALLLVTLGANVYKQTVSHMNDHFNERTVYAYITEKIRQNDVYDGIDIGELGGEPALVLSQHMGDTVYCTYLYLHEGYLKELFTRPDAFSAEDMLRAGQNITPLKDMKMEKIGDSLIRLTIFTGDGEPVILYASVHCKE